MDQRGANDALSGTARNFSTSIPKLPRSIHLNLKGFYYESNNTAKYCYVTSLEALLASFYSICCEVSDEEKKNRSEGLCVRAN